MSTYYYMVCDEHKLYCDGASRSAGGVGHLGSSDELLPRFITEHAGCSVRIASEHDEAIFSYEEMSNHVDICTKCGGKMRHRDLYGDVGAECEGCGNIRVTCERCAHYIACGRGYSNRVDGACGPDGKLWEPRQDSNKSIRVRFDKAVSGWKRVQKAKTKAREEGNETV